MKSNDKTQPPQVLKVTGKVEDFAYISPKQIRFKGTIDQPLQVVVNIIPDKYPFKITDVTADKGDNIQYKFEEFTSPKGLGYKLIVDNLKNDEGWYRDVIHVKTDSDIRPDIAFKVFGRIEKETPRPKPHALPPQRKNK